MAPLLDSSYLEVAESKTACAIVLGFFGGILAMNLTALEEKWQMKNKELAIINNKAVLDVNNYIGCC